MSALETLGVVATSRKENERRLPIHPRHLAEVPEADRRRLILERGYGEPFAVPDRELAPQVGGMAERRRDPRRLRRRAAAQAAAGGPRRDAARRGAVGVAALRAEP